MADTWFGNPGCPCCGAPSPPDTTPGCPCPDGPATIYVKSTRPDLNFGLFNDATLRWIATPSAYTFPPPNTIPSFGYFSDETFHEQSHNDEYRYYLSCDGTSYGLHRVFVTSFFGSPLLDVVRYSWIVGVRGNTCSPFYFLGGTVYPGGNPAGKVYLSAASGDWKIGQKYVAFKVWTGSSSNPIAGATVGLAGATATTDSQGLCAITVAQSASPRPYTVTKAGYSFGGGIVSGEAPVATEAQSVSVGVNMTVAP